MFASAITEVVIKRPRSRPERAAWLGRLCTRVLAAAHIRAVTEGPVPMSGAVISNHLTFLDILVHSSLRPCVFVSKAELRKTPLLGWISMMAGTVYVERGAGGSAAKAAEGMGKGFRDGLPVTFFPEGTTGTGDEVLMPFRSGLIAQAIAAEAPMTPGFIHYELAPGDVAKGRNTRDDIHWGEQSLLTMMRRLLTLEYVVVTARFAENPIDFSPEAVADRKIAALEAQTAVLKVA
jgi:1-acyl-sn-glycerol-3-phosphate acyltransferase